MTARPARKEADWTSALLAAANAAETTEAVVALVRAEDSRLIEYRAAPATICSRSGARAA